MRRLSVSLQRSLARWLAPAALLVAFAPASAQQRPAPTSPTAPAAAPAQAAPAQSAPTAPAGPLQVDRVVAVVGEQPILHSELQEELLMRRAQGLQIPDDSAGRERIERDVLGEMIDTELLLQKARRDSVTVADDELTRQVDGQMKEIRGRFTNDNEFRSELRRAGFGTPEQYRQRQVEILRKAQMQRELIQKLKRDGKLATSTVSDAEVTEAYEASKESIPKREAVIGFRQVVVAPKPSGAAKAAARAKAESLLVEIAKGGDFEQIAKRESMDPGSKELGGDLGWNRRGRMLKEFDDMMFALPAGRVSPIVETAYGYHVIKVDRVRPAEVKARHVLIRPRIDSADARRARLEADSVRQALDRGADLDSLVAKHHDPIENSSLPEFPKAQLPASYAAAIGDAAVNAIVGPFTIDDAANGMQKYVVLRVTTAIPAGDYPEAEVRLRLREQLAEAKTVRKLVDSLRKGTYVSLRYDAAADRGGRSGAR